MERGVTSSVRRVEATSCARLPDLCLLLAVLFGGAFSSFAQTVPAPASAPAPAPAPKPPAPLRVAVYANSPPMIFKSGDKYSGIEAEFARGFAAALGRPVEFINVDWNDLIPALLDDRADIIMSGLSITTLRQVRVAFCDPYLRIGQVPLCRRGELALYGNNAALYNIRGSVGVVTEHDRRPPPPRAVLLRAAPDLPDPPGNGAGPSR